MPFIKDSKVFDKRLKSAKKKTKDDIDIQVGQNFDDIEKKKKAFDIFKQELI